MLFLWLQFILCSGVIVLCGTNLSRNGDVIAEKSGLGRAWIGLILMAGVTSLPELITGISSVTLADTPDIALGDVMGSCVFNLAIIALMDILHGPGPLFSRAEHGHTLIAGFGIILIGIASMAIAAGGSLPSFLHIGVSTPVIICLYGFGMRSVFLYQKKKIARHSGEIAEQFRYGAVSLRSASVKYALNSAVIIGAATWLPFLSARIADATGFGRSFTGSVLVALTTSLPELVVSIAALRIGAADLAIANLLGSNMFNILILALDDMAFFRGPLLVHVSPNHIVTGLVAIVMTGITVVSLTYRKEKKPVLRLGWDALALILAYVVNVLLLYAMRGSG